MILEYNKLEYKNKVIFEKMVMTNFERAPKPAFENEACFMYLQEGSFQFRTPERLFSLSSGDAVLAKCNNYFFEQTKKDHQVSPQSKGIGAYLYPEIIKELFDFDLSISDFETDYDATSVNTDLLMKNFIDGIEFLLDNPSVCNESMVKIKLKEFILLLSKTENAPSLLDFVSSLFKPHEYDFKQIIETNILSSLSISELAKLCGMSVSTFQRTFQSVFEQTPSKYILEQKLIKAKEMLADKKKRISDVAYDCGFQSTSTFNRSFKKFFHYSPTDFRLNEIEQ
ncbi:MAG: helix-turn-helix domain-containing protein [Crocinitomicaceae bacterium]